MGTGRGHADAFHLVPRNPFFQKNVSIIKTKQTLMSCLKGALSSGRTHTIFVRLVVLSGTALDMSGKF
jgi:hypothetical protein